MHPARIDFFINSSMPRVLYIESNRIETEFQGFCENFDNHPLFRSSVVTTNNADSVAALYATATTSTGQAATSGGEEHNKTAWWKFGGKKAEETKNKEVDVDYGFS